MVESSDNLPQTRGAGGGSAGGGGGSPPVNATHAVVTLVEAVVVLETYHM